MPFLSFYETPFMFMGAERIPLMPDLPPLALAQQAHPFDSP